MTFTKDETISRHREAFQSLSVDDQLALFWFIYKEMGASITPAAPGASTVSPTIAEGLFNQVKDLSHEEQLQLQRDLISNVSHPLSREYGAMGDTTKLLFWYNLAQGMDNGTIVPMPTGYELNGDAGHLFDEIKKLEFQKQITLFRDIVSPMGAEPAAGIEI